jgi:hypothetical protein
LPLSKNVYEGEWKAKREAQSISRIKAKIKKSAETFLKKI